jgi:hypothetical protein
MTKRKFDAHRNAWVARESRICRHKINAFRTAKKAPRQCLTIMTDLRVAELGKKGD